MKIIAGIQAYEEEDFIKPTLLSLKQFCDKIIVVEGCWENTLKITKSKRSRDKTVEIIKDIIKNNDKENKIELHYYNGKNQKAHRLHILNLCWKYKPDWYLQGDGDEIFHEKEIPELINLMKSTKKYSINPKHKLFWNDLYHYELWNPTGRFFKFTNLNKNKLIYSGCNNYKYLKKNIFTDQEIPDNIYIYHPSYVKNFNRQLLKWNHRSLDDSKKFPHKIDHKLKMVYRSKYMNVHDFQNQLNKISISELPFFLQEKIK